MADAKNPKQCSIRTTKYISTHLQAHEDHKKNKPLPCLYVGWVNRPQPYPQE